MTDTIPRLEDLPSPDGATVLVRVDFNVPLQDGRITDDLRITTALPTLRWLLDEGARVVACGHLGRPKGAQDSKYSMAPVAARLSELLETDVPLAPGVVGDDVDDCIGSLDCGQMLLLENLRFEAGETENSPGFATSLVSCCDRYVNDAFGASHREHASIVGPPHIVPCAGGRLLEREVEVLSTLLEGARRPFVAVLGGAKVSDKLGVISALLDRVDTILVGGAMAFTFLLAQDHDVGDSLVEPEMVDQCARLLESGRVRIPSDVVIAREIADDADARTVGVQSMPAGWKGLDIGPGTAAEFADEIAGASTVLWNGPMGVFEMKPFEAGTRTVAQAVADTRGFTVVGGGDSAAAIREFGLAGDVDHVSTGGGASLEYIEHGDLPGLRALREGKHG